MNVTLPFSAMAKTLDVSVTSTASSSIQLPGTGNSVRIVNEGPNVCFVSIGEGAQTATLPVATYAAATFTSTPVAVGDCVLGVPNSGSIQISAITRATQTARLSVQVSEGV